MKSLFLNGKPVDDNLSRVCILYDPKDGRVVHVHGVTTLDNRKKISDSEMETRTVDRAKAMGRSTAGMKALHVPISAIRRRGAFKVNVKDAGLGLLWHTPPDSRELLKKFRNDKPAAEK